MEVSVEKSVVNTDIKPIGEPIEEILEVNASDSVSIVKPTRARNYSFASKMSDPKKKEKFEVIEVAGLGEVSIPATMGSTYWAILRVCYEHVNIQIYPEQLVGFVETLMLEVFPERWSNYTGKTSITTFRKTSGGIDRKKINSWQDRIIGNAKTLTRTGGASAYGLRLSERGHCLSFEYDTDKKSCFILRTTIQKV